MTTSNQFLRKSLIAMGIAGTMSFSSAVFANDANPNPIKEVQPDGTVITLHVRGDEHFNWSEDKDGFTVMKHNGWYKYAKRNSNGRLEATPFNVGHVNPKALGLTKRTLPSKAVQKETHKTVAASSTTASRVLPMGDVKNLVVMVRFSNHGNRDLPSVADIDVLMNAPNGDPQLAPTGSVRDVYLENSYGQMRLNSDVQPWIDVSNTEQYYANGQSGDSTLWEALREALTKLDETIDFRDYDGDGDGKIDAIAFFHSGYGAEWGGTDSDGTAHTDRIWSHRWTIQNSAWTSEEGISVSDYHISPAMWGTAGNDIGRIGVIAHETGHFFGLPDLYDTDGGGAGIGSYGLMANSWDFEGTQYCPPHFSPWSKERLGWYTAQEISADGQYTLREAANHPDVYKITTGFPSGEYLMVENRQNSGFDCTMPQGGLAVWHIDEATGHNTEGYPGQRRWPDNGNHYQVALLQADGNYDMEKGINRGDSGDLYHGQGNDAIHPGPGGHPNTDTYQNGQINQTGVSVQAVSVSSNEMTFCLNACSQSSMPAPSNLIASVQTSGKGKNATKTVTLNWQDNSSNEDQFIIERCEEIGKGQTKSCNFSTLATVGANQTTFADVPGSGIFKYRVMASNASESSGFSNEVKI